MGPVYQMIQKLISEQLDIKNWQDLDGQCDVDSVPEGRHADMKIT